MWISRAPLLPVARVLSADIVCENSWSGIQSSGFYLQTPCSEELGTDFRKPMLNIRNCHALVWTGKFCDVDPWILISIICRQGIWVVPHCLFGSVVGNVDWEIYQLTLLTRAAEQSVIHVNTDPAREVLLCWSCCSVPFYCGCSGAPGVRSMPTFQSSVFPLQHCCRSLWELALFGDFQFILHWEWWPEIHTEQPFTPQYV